jgi:serine/threonine protein kinase
MACLRVPFEGNSIQELYKKINKGIISRIPKKYSKELSDMIKLCLTKDQKKRPSVSELLEHPVILKKMGTKIPMQEDIIPGELWQTIKLPKNLDQLIQRLPQKKYRDSKERRNSKERRKSARAYSMGTKAEPVIESERNFKKKDKE